MEAAFELQQLALAIKAVSDWATYEEDFVSAQLSNRAQRAPSQSSTDKSLLKEHFTNARDLLGPLTETPLFAIASLPVPDATTTLLNARAGSVISSIPATELGRQFADDSMRLENLQRLLPAILPAYIPELVLAYGSILHSAGHFLSRGYFVASMELAAMVASEEGAPMAQLLGEQGRMRELVGVFARTSRAMVASKKREEKKNREWKGETIGVWEVGARN